MSSTTAVSSAAGESPSPPPIIREQSVRLHDGNAVSDVLNYSSRFDFLTLFMPSCLTVGQLSDSARIKSDFDGELPLFPSDTLSMPLDNQNYHSLGDPQLPPFFSFSPALSLRKLIPDSSPTGSPSFSTSSTLLETYSPAAASIAVSVSVQSFLSLGLPLLDPLDLLDSLDQMSIVAAPNRIASARKTSANAKRKLMSSDEKSYALPLEMESKMAMEDLNKLASKDFRSSSTSPSTTTASPSSSSSSSSSSTSSSSSSFAHLIAHTAANELSVKANLF
ncbi:uncharacterized protein MONOS_11985 [Monocercomonoides exilis]|uniref:uncharacterized protein n=1 Tax=Monocercomonoides exilis TaxID=2049356 RepID=UPI00355AC289|nr:hypothetical protein MONOS_11985 [Monocercomonoides exilis]|eukprot:MONOS_11985.1-p1 / transcript=MONOS_11985.1 / gene=MONOS_11985 / organism=Monocercomonoides_exilis_PA203 / gene_product=unspecified product / transcript_product=unspecified product / location=Mono_scaffold00633:7941-8872(-) / protein_length=278 / sequence_SO=supercontig / SO=protein_coding / is_pseudo=false